VPTNTLARLVSARAASRLWARDTTVFSAAADSAVREAVLMRLGWLDAPAAMAARVPEIQQLVREVRQDGLTQVCLLGMGGSSLCAEVLKDTLAAPDVREHIHVLDTTDERAVRQASAALDPAKTLFVVASKSGSTVEVTALEAYFRAWASPRTGARTGRHFIAITDPDTALVAHAAAHQYRHTFINPADIGGRYSALSLFGLVPAALMGIAPAQLLERAVIMADACREDTLLNPGLALGVYMAAQARLGRNKLTLLLPESMSALGLWIEQLVAESTGKRGQGVLPIVDEPSGHPSDFGADRAFVLVTAPDAEEAVTWREALAAEGHPVFHLESTPAELGAEFFRWEFATAIAGAVLQVNPFDEPNVREAKTRTMAMLAGPRPLAVTPPLVERNGVLGRTHRPAPGVAAETGTFVAILDYLPVDDQRAEAVAHVRTRIRERTGAATTHGLGPRYLHSTGQFHKGGTNSGLFLLLTAADATETPVPGADYSFSVLKHAQALGDFEALVAADRHVIHYHITDAEADFSTLMESLLMRQ
jgi:glucose-6-phosphate isomerase